MCRCCCKNCRKYEEIKEQKERIRKGKRKKRCQKIKAVIKNYKITIMFIVIMLLIPIIVGVIYAIPIPQVLMVESGDVLSYYATSLGIIGSFITYREEKKKEKKERNRDIRPKLVLEVEQNKEKENIFKVDIRNIGKTSIQSVSVFDREICSCLEEGKTKTINVKFTDGYKSDEDDSISINYNVQDIELNNGIPNCFLILCNDVDNQLWGLYYDKLPNEANKLYYSLNDFYLC